MNSMVKSGYFSTTQDGKVYYNENKISELLSIKSKSNDLSIQLTAKFFAKHEIRHRISPFKKFYKSEWKIPSEDEFWCLRRSSYGKGFNYQDLKYNVEEYLINRNIPQKLKSLDKNLFTYAQVEKTNQDIKDLNSYIAMDTNDEFEGEKLIQIRNNGIKKGLGEVLTGWILIRGLGALSSLILINHKEFLRDITQFFDNKIDSYNLQKENLDNLRKLLIEFYENLVNKYE